MLNCYCQLSTIFRQYGVSQSECKIDRPRPGLSRLESPGNKVAYIKQRENENVMAGNENAQLESSLLPPPGRYSLKFSILEENLLSPSSLIHQMASLVYSVLQRLLSS